LSHRWTQIHTDEIKIVFVVSVFIRVDLWLFIFTQFWFRPHAGLSNLLSPQFDVRGRIRAVRGSWIDPCAPHLQTAGLLALSNIHMKEPVKRDFLWAALCLLGAVYFVFRDKATGL
jgi:hypothetical protein